MEGFGQNGAMQTQREVEDEFHARAASRAAQVERPPRKRREDASARVEGLLFPADQNYRFRFSHQGARTADSSVEIEDSARGQARTET